ncbi:SGNH/GDSL hydrolase family protein [Myxococcota bacterium]|nr:SGNH/GDSL hydrolase family protein [Myxococcota bacterium]
MKAILQNVLLVCVSVGLCLLGLEAAYRVKLVMNPFKPLEPIGQFTASPSVYGVHDEAHGVRYEPGTSHRVVTVRLDGRVTWAPERPISQTNADGFMGKTLRAEYDAAEVKVVTFGDSFTHWSQEGETWPDFLQVELAKRLGKSVAVLNQGRGGYGLMQMFDLAADTLPALKPDLAVIAFISDDVSRDRWWTKTVVDDGYTRPLLSPSPTNFDLSVAADEYVVNTGITPEWAKAAMADPTKAEPLLGELITQYRHVRADFLAARGVDGVHRSVWSLRESYLLNRITKGTPVPDDVSSIPRTELRDFGEDARFVAAVKALDDAKIPYVLVHLPISFELAARETIWEQKASIGTPLHLRQLVTSLERITKKSVIKLHDETEGVTVPPKIDLVPDNGHPNLAGLRFYGELVAKVAARTLGAR